MLYSSGQINLLDLSGDGRLIKMSEESRTTSDVEPSAKSLIEQIVDATLSDPRVTTNITKEGVELLRDALLAKKLVKPDEIVAAANHRGQPGETS